MPGSPLDVFTVETTATLNSPRFSPDPLAQTKAKLHTAPRPFTTWLKLLSVKLWHVSAGCGGPIVRSGDVSLVLRFALSDAVARTL
jgi:hypothetical protein